MCARSTDIEHEKYVMGKGMAESLKPEFTICPYCNGEVIGGRCRDCGWRPEYEYPPQDDYGMPRRGRRN